MAATGGGGGRREGSAKSIVADQISQSVQSTSNLLHLMHQSSPSHVLEQLPQVISLLDAHVERGLQSAPHLNTVSQLLFNMQNNQLKSLSRAQFLEEETKPSAKNLQ